LAQKYNLPIVIHAREAMDEVVEHFIAIPAVEKDWYFGFDGNLTYDEGLQNIIKLLPEDRILLETDSPYLAPIPYRRETCPPAYIPLIQAKINEIIGKDLTEQIRKNTNKLFQL